MHMQQYFGYTTENTISQRLKRTQHAVAGAYSSPPCLAQLPAGPHTVHQARPDGMTRRQLALTAALPCGAGVR